MRVQHGAYIFDARRMCVSSTCAIVRLWRTVVREVWETPSESRFATYVQSFWLTDNACVITATAVDAIPVDGVLDVYQLNLSVYKEYITHSTGFYGA